MPHAAELQQREAGVQGRLEILDEVERKHRRELLGGERILLPDALQFGADDAGIRRHFETRHPRNGGRGLADALRIHRPVRHQQQLAERLLLGIVGDVSLVGFEQAENPVAQRGFRHQRLLARADRPEIEAFTGNHLGDGFFQVGRGIHQHRNVARSHPERRLAAGIGGLHHARAAGGQDHGGALVPHQGAGGFERGVIDALDDAFGRARFHRRLVQNSRCVAGALVRARMRAENDGVARFERNERLVNRRGSGIGSGQNGRHHSHGNAHLHHFFFRQLAQYADRLHAPHAPRQPVRAQDVLDVLILGVAVAGLFHRHLGETPGIGARGGPHPLDDGVDLLLGKATVFEPCGIGLLDLGADLLDREKVFVLDHHPLLLDTASGEDPFHLLMRPWDHVNADQLADAPGRGRTRVRGRLHRAHIAAHGDAHHARPGVLLALQHHVGGLAHGIGGLYGTHQTLRFNQAKGLHHYSSSSFSSERPPYHNSGGRACSSLPFLSVP